VPGYSSRQARVWEYKIATDTLTELARASPAFSVARGSTFLTQAEESSGVIDITSLMTSTPAVGEHYYLATVQARYSTGDFVTVEGGNCSSSMWPQSRRGSSPSPRLRFWRSLGCVAGYGTRSVSRMPGSSEGSSLFFAIRGGWNKSSKSVAAAKATRQGTMKIRSKSGPPSGVVYFSPR